jgi:hypothetical protein
MLVFTLRVQAALRCCSSQTACTSASCKYQPPLHPLHVRAHTRRTAHSPSPAAGPRASRNKIRFLFAALFQVTFDNVLRGFVLAKRVYFPYLSTHCRGFFSFTVVTLGAVLSFLGRSFEATVVALFPSVFIPIMVGSWLAQGKAVPFGAVGPLTIGSMCTPLYRCPQWPAPLSRAALMSPSAS